MQILLDKLDFHEPWAYDIFSDFIKHDHKLCVIPFAYHESWIKNNLEWENAYHPMNGKHYDEIIKPFMKFGLKEENIVFINNYSDEILEMKQKINSSDILLFTGGYPDRIMNRLRTYDLVDTVQNFSGMVMGWSAGAMILCEDYFISPDEDYLEYTLGKGLAFGKDFAIEVHYKAHEAQDYSINRFHKEFNKDVYTTQPNSAIIIYQNHLKLIGNAKLASKKRKLK